MRLIGKIIFLLLVVGNFWLFWSLGTGAYAFEVWPKWPEWTEESKLNLGRCFRAESQERSADWAAIGHVLVKRWQFTQRTQGWTINNQIEYYCRCFSNGTPRARQIKNSTWSKPLHGTIENWKTIREYVDEFTAGNIPDPLPMADHWAEPELEAPTSWDIICASPLTANIFYREN